jgi:hypothetical protein
MFEKIIDAFNKLKCKIKIHCCCKSECVKNPDDEIKNI